MPSDKEILWEQKLDEVDRIIDGIGKGIDEGIKEVVAVFLLYKFPTSASCEGHITFTGEMDYAFPYPWVDFETLAPEGWIDDEQKKQEWTQKNLVEQQRLVKYLDEFYRGRDILPDAKLVLDCNMYQAWRLQSAGAEMMRSLTAEQRMQKYDLYRKEMQDFARFLKEKYFAEG